MNPLLDQILVGLIVAGAIGFFILRLVRRRKKGCDSGCGCDVAKQSLIRKDPADGKDK